MEVKARRKQSMYSLACFCSFVISAVFVFQHMLGWYGYQQGLGSPLSLKQAAVEFVVLFPGLAVLFFIVCWLKMRSAKQITNFKICPACKIVILRDAFAACKCGIQYEDLAGWKWVPHSSDKVERPGPKGLPRLTLIQRIHSRILWIISGV